MGSDDAWRVREDMSAPFLEEVERALYAHPSRARARCNLPGRGSEAAGRTDMRVTTRKQSAAWKGPCGSIRSIRAFFSPKGDGVSAFHRWARSGSTMGDHGGEGQTELDAGSSGGHRRQWDARRRRRSEDRLQAYQRVDPDMKIRKICEHYPFQREQDNRGLSKRYAGPAFERPSIDLARVRYGSDRYDLQAWNLATPGHFQNAQYSAGSAAPIIAVGNSQHHWRLGAAKKGHQQHGSSRSSPVSKARGIDMKLEIVVIPVSDVDRAKAF